MKLEVKNLSFSYKNQEILKDINISFSQGEKVSIIAPSGYGKSTLAKILAGYEKAKNGEILLDGKPLTKGVFNPVQLIFQNPELSFNPKLTIEESLKDSKVNLNDSFFEIFEIEKSWQSKYPNELSGGELQRVAIARALNEKTKFIIADEITSMLDNINQAKVWNYLLHVTKKHFVGMINITHDIHLAQKISDKIINLEEINHI
ncbi:MAG: ABC transporter ATP-binding protein [Campylobacteraceae bacterium]